jgi:uncharacterized membrane protein HdeD (DUF308 family)
MKRYIFGGIQTIVGLCLLVMGIFIFLFSLSYPGGTLVSEIYSGLTLFSWFLVLPSGILILLNKRIGIYLSVAILVLHFLNEFIIVPLTPFTHNKLHGWDDFILSQLYTLPYTVIFLICYRNEIFMKNSKLKS